MGIIVAFLDITDQVKHVELGVRASGLELSSQDAFKAVIHKGIHDSRLSLGMVQLQGAGQARWRVQRHTQEATLCHDDH